MSRSVQKILVVFALEKSSKCLSQAQIFGWFCYSTIRLLVVLKAEQELFAAAAATAGRLLPHWASSIRLCILVTIVRQFGFIEGEFRWV